MATSVVMPALEMAQETGRIVSWLKKEGETISKGDPLLEVETDKAVVEIEATADGVLAGIKSHDGDVVTVGVTIAWIVAPGEEPPAELPSAAPAARKTSEPASSHPTAAPAKETPASSGEGATRISPKARRLAEERGLDIRRIRGTGPDGSITSEDVLKAADAQSAPAEPVVNASDSPTLTRRRAQSPG
jgi:pyruvate dehydrogenase E2 component (dihydrolipoamide acetyltransferase)